MSGQTGGFRKKTFFAWLAVVGVCLGFYLTRAGEFDVELIRLLVHENRRIVIPLYLALLSVLGLTFIPSTPFAIAGVVLFEPGFAYLLNLVGILTSSTIVYHFARFLGLGDALEQRYPGKVDRVRNALARRELPLIVAWSFFPVVPTDLIIYAASSLRVPLWKCILGVLLGEGTLNAAYLFGVNAAL